MSAITHAQGLSHATDLATKLASRPVALLDRPVSDRATASSRQIKGDSQLIQFSARLTARIRDAETRYADTLSQFPQHATNLRPPLVTDPLAHLFCGVGGVSSEFDHTHFLYRKMWSRYAEGMFTFTCSLDSPILLSTSTSRTLFHSS